MTAQEALQEARRRWGLRARVRFTVYTLNDGQQFSPEYPYEVRSKPIATDDMIWGIGRSWEEAFADACQRAQEPGRKSNRESAFADAGQREGKGER